MTYILKNRVRICLMEIGMAVRRPLERIRNLTDQNGYRSLGSLADILCCMQLATRSIHLNIPKCLGEENILSHSL